ncbi:hypothetical protein [Phytohabitans maris]|uniref:hypothetical protein n=1 Tax=Phytohabitans maris TaxID=3071409 RepID=UPI003D17F12A
MDALAAAQRAGIVDAVLPAGLVLTLAAAWTEGAPEGAADPTGRTALKARRAAIVTAVRRLAHPVAG